MKHALKYAFYLMTVMLTLGGCGNAESLSSETKPPVEASRISAVTDYLSSEFSIDQTRLEIKGLGESQPIAKNENSDGSDNPEGRQKNRRVDVIINNRETTGVAPATH